MIENLVYLVSGVVILTLGYYLGYHRRKKEVVEKPTAPIKKERAFKGTSFGNPLQNIKVDNVFSKGPHKAKIEE